MVRKIYQKIIGDVLNGAKQGKVKDAKCFPDSIYKSIPPILHDACKVFEEPYEKDIFLLGALTLISGCLPNLFGIYDQRKIESNLYSFIIAPASAGKGCLVWSRMLVLKIHKYLREQEELGKSKMLLIPANNSSSGFLNALSDNDGRGVLFCTEADTLSGAIAQDWGNYSDVMRAGFHHEPISFMRRGNKEYFEMEQPHISILLSGTPGQVKKLIPNHENGLFSRFCFYSFSVTPTMKDVFAEHEIDFDEHFENLSEDVFQLYIRLEKLEQPIKFKFTDEQKHIFLKKFDTWHKQYFNLYAHDFISSVRRLGIILKRMAMIFSILRIIKDDVLPKTLVCKQVDFETALALNEKLIFHTEEILTRLQISNRDEKLIGEKKQFYSKLPDDFTRKTAVEIAAELDISTSTMDRLLREEDFFIKYKHGSYKKVI